MLREALAEIFQRAGGGVPVLDADQRGRGVVLRRRVDGRLRRHAGHTGKVAHGVARVAGLLCRLALLVDRRGLALDQVLSRGVALGHQGQHLCIALLGTGEVAGLERGVRDHGGGHAALFRRGRRVQREHALGNALRLLRVLQCVQAVGRIGQHRRDTRVLVEGLRESQRAVHALALQRGLVGCGRALVQLGMGQQRGVAGVGALVVPGVAVGHLLVLDSRLGPARVLVQQLAQQEVVARGVGLTGEAGDDVAVPAHRFLVVGAGLGLLRAGVIVARQLGQPGLHQRLGLVPAFGVGLAELAVDAIAADVFALGVERQRGQAALLVDVDDLRLQQRRLRMHRVALDEGGVSVCRVLDAVLLDVELAELLVDAELVALAPFVLHVGGDRLGALQVGQRDAHHAEGVFHQFAVASREPGQAVQRLIATAGQLAVEHAEERLQAFLELALLESGPALHVKGAVLEHGAGIACQHGVVGLFGRRVAAQGEQQFAAAELRFLAVGGVRIGGHELVERLERGLELAALLLSTGELVEHAIVARVLRVGAKELLVARDGRLVVGRGGIGAGDAAGVGDVHLQVAEPSHRLGALWRVPGLRRGVEKAAIGRDGLGFVGRDAAVLVHRHGARPQAGQRGGVVVGGRLGAAAAAGQKQDAGRRDERGTTNDAAHRPSPSWWHWWPGWPGRRAGPAQSGPGSGIRPGAAERA